MFAGHLKGVAFNIILFKQEINENKTMVSRFKTICQELHEIINEKEVQQRDFESKYTLVSICEQGSTYTNVICIHI